MRNISILLLLFFISLPSQAQSSRPSLESKMTYYDVLKLWGPPSEKLEHEAKRGDVWMYGDSKVIFSNGKVAAWTDSSSENQLSNVIAMHPSGGSIIKGVRSNGSAAPTEENDQAVEAILKDIMKDGGGSSETPPSPGPPGAGPEAMQADRKPMPIAPE